MAHVNLLPWRELARQRAKTQFGLHAVLAIGFAALLLVITYMVIADFQQTQDRRNNFLRGQIQVLDQQIAEIQSINEKKDEIINRMQLIQSLHQDRNTAIRILNELAERTPDGVFINTAEKRDQVITIYGSSVSNNRVSEFLRALKESPLFDRSDLREVIADHVDAGNNEQLKAFALSISIRQTTPQEGRP